MAKETKKLDIKKTISENEMVFCILNFLAPMETASSCGGVRHKRYSEQRD